MVQSPKKKTRTQKRNILQTVQPVVHYSPTRARGSIDDRVTCPPPEPFGECGFRQINFRNWRPLDPKVDIVTSGNAEAWEHLVTLATGWKGGLWDNDGGDVDHDKGMEEDGDGDEEEEEGLVVMM